MNGQHFADLLPGTAVGGFIVEALLGRGGSGVVYRARRGGESFALKLQSRMGLGGWAAREVAILMRLEHPNVVGFRHCGLHPEQRPTWFYLAMELVEGRTLHQWVREENPSARRVVALMRDLSRGLEAMHARQTLHRDIKESNIQVRESTGQAVLLDVGVGHYEGAPRLTQGILPPGTPQYRSPESLAYLREHGRQEGAHYEASRADDLYALGVVFYWMLTDRRPFESPDTATEIDAVIHEPPVPPQVRNARVPEALGQLCLRLLAKAPEARGEGARALDEALAALVMDAAWDVPLLPDVAEVPLAPVALDEAEEHDAWMVHGEAPGPPHRGRVPVPPVMPMPALAPLPSPPSVRRWGAGWKRWGLLACGVAVLVAALGGLARSHLSSRPESDPEVASAKASPEAARAAVAPPWVAVPPVAVASQVAHSWKEETPVTKTSPAPARRNRSRAAASRALLAAATCSTLACSSGPQVRASPPPEACPAGAVESMRTLGIKVGKFIDAALDDRFNNVGPISVREGPGLLETIEPMGKLPGGTLVLGRFVRGEYLYGRFTEVRTKKGERYPVCMEIFQGSGIEHGVTLLKGSTDDTAVVTSTVYLRAVDHFE
ncbi:serine/threonine-protein kinase [Corallococcus sp. BB11-1]|uniref:serine/threonine protein kinase n=1 Tax=Corallococcus sp. BB11-1 TaxID=2996783 RepID=UPI00226F46FE|nr:serine/threonine-protein kinase [Corallococcus sp. BB11-1]MCY1030533.1 serine/threonine-protein kinase [Corallococcus sp. BB11-1]